MNDIPVVEDIGSGVLIDLSKYGLSYEPTVQESIKNGVDVVTFSGDKLLGGPQAGIIIGKKKYIDKMKKNQLLRAIRIDKLTLAALEATLRLYLDEKIAVQKLPTLSMLTKSPEELEQKAKKLCEVIEKELTAMETKLGEKKSYVEVMEDYSLVGGGAMPLTNMKTYVVALSTSSSLDELDKTLRHSTIPIITRIKKDKLIFDVRTVMEEDFFIVAKTLTDILGDLK